MAYARGLGLFSLLLLLCNVNSIFWAKPKDKCRPIPFTDVKVAIRASINILKLRVSVGDYVPGTTFKVTKTLNPRFRLGRLRTFVADDDKSATTMIVFRATNTPQQLLEQFASSVLPKKKLRYKDESMEVMEFYWSAVQRFSPDTLVPGGVKSGRKYIITGYSLGGSLASLFSLYMRMKDKGLFTNPDSSLILFGPPRVGDKNYARIHDKLISPNRKLKIVYGEDVADSFPPKFLNYRHHSRKVWIKKRLGFFKFNTYIKVCKLGDDPSGCSSKLRVVISQLDHLLYFKSILGDIDGFYDKNGASHTSFEEAQCK